MRQKDRISFSFDWFFKVSNSSALQRESKIKWALWSGLSVGGLACAYVSVYFYCTCMCMCVCMCFFYSYCIIPLPLLFLQIWYFDRCLSLQECLNPYDCVWCRGCELFSSYCCLMFAGYFLYLNNNHCHFIQDVWIPCSLFMLFIVVIRVSVVNFVKALS